MRWLGSPDGTLVFARDPGFVFAANLGAAPVPLPPHREVLLASGALAPEGALPRDTAVWLAT
jgi:alpha-glucosidase